MKKFLITIISLCLVIFSGCQHDKIGIEEVTTDKNEHGSMPIIISATIDDLKAIRNAAYTMSQEEYNTYMISNHSGRYINGMHSLENTKIILKEFEETTIPVLDGNAEKIQKLSLYRNSHCIHQLIIYDSEEIQRTSVWIYTVDSEKSEVLEFGEEVEVVSTETIETDRYTANLYETRNADYEFFGEITVDDSYIILRSGGIETMEEFEECFSRLEFRKIGDLMNEIPEETSSADKTEAETTLQDEAETDITTDISEETTIPKPTEEVPAE